MKRSSRLNKWTLSVIAVCLAALACSGRADNTESQNQALDILNQRNIFFSPEEFVDLVECGDADNVSVFIRAGMNPNTSIEGFELPVHIAAFKGHTDTLRVLLDAGAFPNMRSSSGWTPMMLATLMHHAECVDLLLEKGADPGIQNESGMTTLMLAVQERNPGLVKSLLKAGANPDIRNEANVSAISIALETRQNDIISMMEKTGHAKAVAAARKQMQAGSKKGQKSGKAASAARAK